MTLFNKLSVTNFTASTIPDDFLKDFAHHQKITRKWVRTDAGWELEDASILREWDAEKRIWLVGYMREKIQNGGMVMAAFLPEGQLAGFCCVGGDLAGETASYANLLLLFVDDRFKRHGIGRLLLQEACRYAKKLGAEKLFLSAIPSEDTIAFYQNMGCVDAKYADRTKEIRRASQIFDMHGYVVYQSGICGAGLWKTVPRDLAGCGY